MKGAPQTFRITLRAPLDMDQFVNLEDKISYSALVIIKLMKGS